MYHSLTFLVGTVLLYRSFNLPNPYIVLIILSFACLLYITKKRPCSLIATLLIGYSIAALHEHLSTPINLTKLLDVDKAQLNGCITNIKNYSNHFQKIQIAVNAFEIHEQRYPLDTKIVLSNYKPLAKSISPGWCGLWQAKLKPAHGIFNDRGYDFETWAFVNDIVMQGTLIAIDPNQVYKSNTIAHRLNRFRSDAADKIQAMLPNIPASAIVLALGLGDRQLMSADQWLTLRRTGTSHLLAISGMHIGLVFFLIYSVTRVLLCFVPRVSLHFVSSKIASIVGLFVAAMYLALSGFPLSGNRALVMLIVSVLLYLTNQRVNFWLCLNVSIICILLIWPKSVLAAGFWFSFSAVALILIQLSSHNRAINQSKIHSKLNPLAAKYLKRILSGLKIQLILWLSLMALTVVYFNEIVLLAPLANIIAIPIVSLIVMPLILLGLFFLILGVDFLSQLVLQFSLLIIEKLYELLHLFSEMDGYILNPLVNFESNWYFLIAATMLWLIYKGLSGRMIMLIVFIPFIIKAQPQLKSGEFELMVFDVGQGLSVLIKTRSSNTLVDTGFGIKGGFSYFEAAVLPVLTSKGIHSLNTLIISHNDRDHSGGYDALMDSSLSVSNSFSSDKLQDNQIDYCHAGISWQHDGVTFEFLTLDSQVSENNRSCVLKVSSQYGSTLLPGDIERSAEYKLGKRYPFDVKSDVLLLAHHGSKTSSSASFLKRVNAKLAIISAGYKNRYNHPAEVVIKRLNARKIGMLNTACHGQINVKFTNSSIGVSYLRHRWQPFWRHRCQNISE